MGIWVHPIFVVFVKPARDGTKTRGALGAVDNPVYEMNDNPAFVRVAALENGAASVPAPESYGVLGTKAEAPESYAVLGDKAEAPVAPLECGGVDYISEAGAQAQVRTPRKPGGEGGAVSPRNMTSGQLKRELKSRGAEPPEGATRDAMREMLLGLLDEDHV